MTGRDGNKVGVWHTIAGRSQLDSRETTIADVFKANGYRTSIFGKWHLGDSYPFLPNDRGFEEALYHGGGGIGQGPDYWDNDYFDDTYYRNGVPEKHSGYCTDIWFDEAIKYISKEDDRPFLTYISTNAPHFPFHIDSSYIRPYLGDTNIVNPNFYGMISNIDENIGKLMGHLESTGKAENTIVIFLTDNGSAGGSQIDDKGHVIKGYNAGMRGKKVWQYEGGHRVPCFIKWPKSGWQGGIDRNELTAHIDLLPTLMENLNLDYNKELDLDGWDISDLLDQNNTPKKNYEERILIVDTQRRQYPLKAYNSSVMMGMWRLIDKIELYDLTTDPSQKKNIINEYPVIRAKLSIGYEKWWDDVIDAFAYFTKAKVDPDKETILYAHDWVDAEMDGSPNLSNEGSHMTPWNQIHIRKGLFINGIWTLDVVENGVYEIELRRWPKEIKESIKNGIEQKEAVSGGNILPIGKALDIIQAELEIDKKTIAAASVKDDYESVIFTVQLVQGVKRLKTTFRTSEGQSLGAYYVHIRKAS
jgi:arylsulfatase A-like enzyme